MFVEILFLFFFLCYSSFYFYIPFSSFSLYLCFVDVVLCNFFFCSSERNNVVSSESSGCEKKTKSHPVFFLNLLFIASQLRLNLSLTSAELRTNKSLLLGMLLDFFRSNVRKEVLQNGNKGSKRAEVIFPFSYLITV